MPSPCLRDIAVGCSLRRVEDGMRRSTQNIIKDLFERIFTGISECRNISENPVDPSTKTAISFDRLGTNLIWIIQQRLGVIMGPRLRDQWSGLNKGSNATKSGRNQTKHTTKNPEEVQMKGKNKTKRLKRWNKSMKKEFNTRSPITNHH